MTAPGVPAADRAAYGERTQPERAGKNLPFASLL